MELYDLSSINITHSKRLLFPKFVIGQCILRQCDPSILKTFDFIDVNLAAAFTTKVNVSYRFPDSDYAALQTTYKPGFYVMIAVMLLSVVLGGIGIVV